MSLTISTSQESVNTAKDLISIVIPVYNTGEYLVECLQSCLDQTYSNIEVIAVDDCSTDPKTIEILKAFAHNDSRIKVIWNEQNRGQGYCRNIGVDQCQGKYFAFIDSDDYFKPNFIEKMYQGLEKYKTDFAICDAFNYVDDPRMYEMKNFVALDSESRFNFDAKDQTVVKNFDLASMGFLLSFPASCYGKMFNTQKYKAADLRFYDGEFSRHCQDEDWAIYTILKLRNFVVLKFTGLMRRMRFGTASSPSINYYRCSVDANYRSYIAIQGYPFSELYTNTIIYSLLLHISNLCFLTQTYTERLEVIDLAHVYLNKFNANFNINPYHYSRLVSEMWPKIVSVLDISPLPIIYFSLRSLHNANWSESYTTKQLLENLASHGLLTIAFTGLCNASLTTLKKYKSIEQEIIDFATTKNQKPKINPNSALFEFNDNGVYYYIAKTTPCAQPSSLNSIDHQILDEGLLKTVKFYLKKTSTSLVLVSGGDVVTQKHCCQLKQQGVKVVYLIDEPNAMHFENDQGQDVLNLDGNFKNLEQNLIVPTGTNYIFAPHQFDGVLSMNPYYAKRFSEIYNVAAESLGYVVNPLVSTLDKGKGSFVTFTNPTLEHGLAIVIKLAERFYKLHPEQKFMIIQDQDHSLQQDLIKLHDASGRSISTFKQSLKQIVFISNTLMDPIDISSQTKVLLAPGLNCSSSISNVLECQINDIPVVASKTDKYESILRSLDHCVVLPESVLKDPYCLPSDKEIEPWVKALEQALSSSSNREIYLKQQDYRQTMAVWMHKLYTIAQLSEVHDHANDERTI